jgi:hypothetical protein
MQTKLRANKLCNKNLCDSGTRPRLTFMPVQEISRAAIRPFPGSGFAYIPQTNPVILVRNSQSYKVKTHITLLFKYMYTLQPYHSTNLNEKFKTSNSAVKTNQAKDYHP